MAQFLAGAVHAVSWTPDSCHLSWMIAAVACGLAPSSCASTLWVDRHSVPWACLSHPWVDFIALMAVFVGWVALLLLFRISDRSRALSLCRRVLFSCSACLSCGSGLFCGSYRDPDL